MNTTTIRITTAIMAIINHQLVDDEGGLVGVGVVVLVEVDVLV
jgi:hypothetical protein